MARRRPSAWQAAWTAGRLAGRRLLGRAVGDQDTELGELLTGQLDQMKGVAMKVGQIVSYLDVPLPSEVRAQLARLQTGREALAPEELREALETALGAQVEALFESFDWEPVAAASIGQVHRAQVDGRGVAVKVRYPGVADSLSGDLLALGRLSSLASLASAVDGRAVVDELAARFAEECDYEREARSQRAFARAFADDPEVVVPEVIGRLSTRGVLTSTWIDGARFQGFETDDADAPGAARRNAIAQTLVRFAYRSLLEFGAIQADPHPGNYLLLPDPTPGTVAFLDYGCVRQLDTTMVQALRDLVASVRDDNRTVFRHAVQALGMVGRAKRFDYDAFFATMEHLHRPFLVPAFAFEPAYVREGYARNGPRNPNARTMAMPPAYVWVARLQWGLWSVLTRLRARGSFGHILETLMSRPLSPMPFDDSSLPRSTA